MYPQILNTITSLLPSYQADIEEEDYEIIVIDNGSQPALSSMEICSMGRNIKLVHMDDAMPSPSTAINVGIGMAAGEVIGVMIDGARICSPGLLSSACVGANLYERSVVCTLGWYLGHDLQRWSISRGYGRDEETALLNTIDWPSDGYRLFDIATMDESSIDGWTGPIAESNAIFMRTAVWHHLGGYDERFTSAGGGLVNLDTFKRAVETESARLIVLPGEGTFHQIHGGVSTNAPIDASRDNWTRWNDEYHSIRGSNYSFPNETGERIYFGRVCKAALDRIAFYHGNPISPRRSSATPAFSGLIGLKQNTELRFSWGDLSPTLEDALAALDDGELDAACASARRSLSIDGDTALAKELVSYLSGHLERSPRLKNLTRAANTTKHAPQENRAIEPQQSQAVTNGVLEFTGERYTPETLGEIALEHRHRYVILTDFVAGKNVLDVACGEGYGSNILARTAKSVVGADVDEISINHCRAKYVGENLTFIKSDIASLPFDDGKFDAIICFETLEHVLDHDRVISELKRVLTPDGFLIISTPDIEQYEAATNGPNPHHLKELSYHEFSMLMARYFENVEMLGQRVVHASFIRSRHNLGKVDYFRERGALGSASKSDDLMPLYHIAVASRARVSPAFDSMYEDESLTFRIQPNVDVSGYADRIAELDVTVSELKGRIDAYQSESDKVLGSKSFRLARVFMSLAHRARRMVGLARSRVE